MMAQSDILAYMKMLRETGDKEYYKPHEIRDKLRMEGEVCERNIRFQCMQLLRYDYLEVRWPSVKRKADRRNWNIAFRYRLPHNPSVESLKTNST